VLAFAHQAREIALHVGREHRNAGICQLLGEQLKGDGLAGAGGTRDQAVPVHHRQRHRDPGVGEHRVALHGGSEVQ